MSVLRTVLGVPFTTRARHEFLFCLLGFLTAYGKPALLGPEGPDEDAEAAGSADETPIAPESPVAPPEQEVTLS